MSTTPYPPHIQDIKHSACPYSKEGCAKLITGKLMDYRICYSTDLITYKLIKICRLHTDMDHICKYWTNKAG